MQSFEYSVREMRVGDLWRGVSDCLSRLRPTAFRAGPAYEFWSARQGPGCVTLVAVDAAGEVVGTASLLLEPKLLGGGSVAGHIEDVAVRQGWDGRGVGSALVSALLERARGAGAYKVILDSSDENAGFYERLGFSRSEGTVNMRVNF